MGKSKQWHQRDLDVMAATDKADQIKVGDTILEPDGTSKRVTEVSEDGKTITTD